MKLLKALVLLAIACNASTKICSQNLVPSEILQRVYQIKYGNEIGTCFYITMNNQDYFVTAKHLFAGNLPNRTKVNFSVLRDSGWFDLSGTYLIHKNANIDIAVLGMGTNIMKENLFDLGSKDYYLSQECFFLGFPFGLRMSGGQSNAGYPIPFVKRGIISAFVTDSLNMTQIFLDGHNNAGFSGGPVVIRNLNPGSKHKMRIIGVVTAYLNENKKIKTPLGDFVNPENSGIVLSYAFDHVLEIINQ